MFAEMQKSLTDYSNLIPVVGERFSRIVDNFSGDTFINCIVIDITELGYWSDLDVSDFQDFAFAIKFKSWLDSDGLIQSDIIDETDVFDEIHFDRMNFITLEFYK
jgi:hypothetical protein